MGCHNPSPVNTIIWQLDSKFSCGVEVLTTPMGLLLSQQKHVIDHLSKHNMLDSKPKSTPLVVDTSLTTHDGIAPINAIMYYKLVGGLQHI